MVAPMRVVLLTTLLAAGCRAPAISVADHGDASIDTAANDAGDVAVETRTCEKVKAPDGGVCEGRHDEDFDCVPDECDDCPSVPQEFKKVSAGTATAGDFCTHPTAFNHATRRLVYDSFETEASSWTEWGGPAIPGEALAIHDGAAHLGALGSGDRFAALQADAGSRDAVALAWMRFPTAFAHAGLALRLQKGPPSTGYFCVVQGGSIKLTYLKCDAGGTCSMKTFLQPSGAEVSLLFPMELDLIHPVVVRFGAKTTPAGVHLECQIFLTPRGPADVKLTLRALDTADHTLAFDVTAPIYPSGDVGLYAAGWPMVVDSLDVLVP